MVYEEEYVLNSRGMKLFTCKWLPANHQNPKALVFLCHGYAMDSSVSMRGTDNYLSHQNPILAHGANTFDHFIN